MVAFSSHKQKGNGAIDNIMKMFSAQKYAGEHHAISFAPDTYGKMMNWMGPGTDIQARTNQDLTPKFNSMPLRKSDLASYSHDISYYKAKKAYDANPTPENRHKQMQKVWEADDKFIEEMKQDPDEPMAPIAGRLIKTKESLEKAHMLPTTVFEGFGEKSDPTARLKQMVEEQYIHKSQSKRTKRNKNQTGGFIPLIPIGVSILGALAGKVIGDVYDLVKKKLTGSGISMKHRTIKDKHNFLLEFLEN